MLLSVLSGIHNLTTMLFGIFISAFFLGVPTKKKQVFSLSILSLFSGILYLTGLFLVGSDLAEQLYPLLVHLPLVLFLVFYYRFSLVSSCTAVTSAYLCCQLSNWAGLFALNLSGSLVAYYIVRILVTVTVFILLCRYVCRTTRMIFDKETRELCIIGFLPFIYYIFDYTSTKFSSLLYSGNKAVVEFMGFALCIAYLVFLLVYFREYEKKQEIRQSNDRMEMQLLSIQKEIEQVRNSEHQLVILRHDMRHHLNAIRSLIRQGNPRSLEKAEKYINEISAAYDETVVKIFCKNEMVNSVISIYQTRFQERGFTLNCEISVGEELSCADLPLCTILSNALENALHALQNNGTAKDLHWASLSLAEKDGHLLLSVENPVLKAPRFVDGIPCSDGYAGRTETRGFQKRSGVTEKISEPQDKIRHGIGVKSIVYYVEKLHGQCHFSVTDNRFILRIIV